MGASRREAARLAAAVGGKVADLKFVRPDGRRGGNDVWCVLYVRDPEGGGETWLIHGAFHVGVPDAGVQIESIPWIKALLPLLERAEAMTDMYLSYCECGHKLEEGAEGAYGPLNCPACGASESDPARDHKRDHDRGEGPDDGGYDGWLERPVPPA